MIKFINETGCRPSAKGSFVYYRQQSPGKHIAIMLPYFHFLPLFLIPSGRLLTLRRRCCCCHTPEQSKSESLLFVPRHHKFTLTSSSSSSLVISGTSWHCAGLINACGHWTPAGDDRQRQQTLRLMMMMAVLLAVLPVVTDTDKPRGHTHILQRQALTEEGDEHCQPNWVVSIEREAEARGACECWQMGEGRKQARQQRQKC